MAPCSSWHRGCGWKYSSLKQSAPCIKCIPPKEPAATVKNCIWGKCKCCSLLLQRALVRISGAWQRPAKGGWNVPSSQHASTTINQVCRAFVGTYRPGSWLAILSAGPNFFVVIVGTCSLLLVITKAQLHTLVAAARPWFAVRSIASVVVVGVKCRVHSCLRLKRGE